MHDEHIPQVINPVHEMQTFGNSGFSTTVEPTGLPTPVPLIKGSRRRSDSTGPPAVPKFSFPTSPFRGVRWTDNRRSEFLPGFGTTYRTTSGEHPT